MSVEINEKLVDQIASQIKTQVTIQHPAKAYCCNFEPL